MEIEVLVCTLSGEQRLERRIVPVDWFGAQEQMEEET